MTRATTKSALKRPKTIGRSPARRAMQASGYADGAAGWVSKIWQGFFATSGSPRSDIDDCVEVLRERSRSVWYRSGLARNILHIYGDWTIGSGLELKSEAREGRDEIEDRWYRWARSKEADSRADADFYSLSRELFESELLNGDVFAILRRVGDEEGKVHLRIEAVEADLCQSPAQIDSTKRIVSGVELDRYGEAIAYHFRQPDGRTKRISRWTSDGDLQVIHLRRRERIGSVRGVPLLAPCLEPILQIERYMASELQSALLESCFSVFVRSDEADPESLLDQPLMPSCYNTVLGSGNINFLPADAEISSISGHRDRNAGSLEKFVEVTLKTNVCSGVGIPYEILTNAFSSSYSASRASCILFARRAEQLRDSFVLDFVQPVFEAWLECERLNGDGLPDDADRATWLGPTPPSLDPQKQIAFLRDAISEGLMTRRQAALELSGTDFDANARQLEAENASLAAANAPLSAENPVGGGDSHD